LPQEKPWLLASGGAAARAIGSVPEFFDLDCA